MGAAQTCCMKQNWLRAHNCSLDLSRQSYKSQASYALLPVNGWEWQRPKGPFLWVLGTLQWVPLDWEISISLAKLFYFWITKSVFPIQSFFHILSISFTGIKLYNLKVLSLSLSFFYVPSSFILHRYFLSIPFGNWIPSLHLLLKQSKQTQKHCTLQKKSSVELKTDQ